MPATASGRAISSRIADEAQDRHVEIGESDRPTVDHEPTRNQADVDDEVFDERTQRGAGPRDEAFAREEATTALALHERLAVVELSDEVDELHDLLAERERA